MSVARLNLSHGTPDEHEAAIARVRSASARAGVTVGILADLPGPKHRLGAAPSAVAGALGAREITVEPDDLIAEVVGDVEKDGDVLVLRRVHVKYKLRVPQEVRDTVARVLEMHADKCPVARSIKGAIEVTTEVEFQ